jgi:hypothetical protein
MRVALPAALSLALGCATLPPLRAADPSQAVANDPSAAAAAAEGVRIVVRPGRSGWSGELEERLTAVEVAIQNASGRALEVRPAHFGLSVPGGLRYDALGPEDVRVVVGPFRGAGPYGPHHYGFYGAYPWPGAFHPWAGFPPGAWWGAYPMASGGLPTRALARGTLADGGSASVLLFFPVPATSLTALELRADLVDAGGRKFGELRVPFARGGHGPVPVPLPPTAAPPAPEGAPR